MVPRNTCDCGASRRPLGIQKKRLSQALSKNIVGGVVFYDTGTYMLSAYYRTSYRQPHNMYQVCVNSFGKVSCLGLQVSFRRCHRLCRCVVGLCASYTTFIYNIDRAGLNISSQLFTVTPLWLRTSFCHKAPSKLSLTSLFPSQSTGAAVDQVFYWPTRNKLVDGPATTSVMFPTRFGIALSAHGFTRK